jgi:hypothetical protein
MKSACSSKGSSHSGCAMILADGCSCLMASSFCRLNVSCTMQLPCHKRMSRPVCFIT